MSRHPLIETIIHQTATEYGVRHADIVGPSTSFTIFCARRMAMQRVRGLTEGDKPRFGYQEIGRAFNRHHTTVMDACEGRQRARPVYQSRNAEAGDNSALPQFRDARIKLPCSA